MSSLHPLCWALTLLFLGSVLPASGAALPFRNLAKGVFSGIQEPLEVVVKDQAAWEQLWKKHSANGRVADRLPDVDFNKEMVIAVTLGRQTTGGFSIQITNVEPQVDALKISVARTAPRAGAMTIQSLTAPFHFVVIARSELKPAFVPGKPEARANPSVK